MAADSLYNTWMGYLQEKWEITRTWTSNLGGLFSFVPSMVTSENENCISITSDPEAILPTQVQLYKLNYTNFCVIGIAHQ
ncbi:hypothetical protein GCM10010917_15580 [Paenibacillus physcomitrellae]|uniref:Uncharacterized protein n=1 Tax=Paenibacillus physcomitrellae TaxID=1619311 RepID=A0ABQ1FW32_9BACL|nr:hypothetical protein GCM10010917_15580 [Paenibacillus physcomitrellae]